MQAFRRNFFSDGFPLHWYDFCTRANSGHRCATSHERSIQNEPSRSADYFRDRNPPCVEALRHRSCVGHGAAFEQKGVNKVNPKEIITSGKKGSPAPPADPQCPMGSSPVGPVTHSTESRACKIDGKDGTKNCYHKMVACLSGPGEQEYAHSENCGPCVALKTQPGQTQTPTGQ